MARPPNYRKASSKAEPDPRESCLDCRFVVDNRCRAYCVRFSVRVNPWFLCDDWASRRVTKLGTETDATKRVMDAR